MSASRLIRLAAKNRGELATQSVEVVGSILPAYQRVNESFLADVNSFFRLIDQSRQNGDVIDADWVLRNPRFRQLITRYEVAIGALDEVLTPAVLSAQSFAAGKAVTDTAALLQVVGVTVNNPVAVAAVNLSESGTWMSRLAPRKAQAAREIILQGVAKGRSPIATARLLAVKADTTTSQALTVVRTEQLRSYREVTRESYVRNPAVEGWRWSSRRSPRTCSSCWEQDGAIYSNDEVMDTHPRCMCAMLPVIEGLDYGPTGREVFTEVMNPEQQRAIVGKATYENGKSILL